MSKILVTGATGLLGASLVPLLEEHGYQVTSLGHRHAADINANLVSYEQAKCALDQICPNIIINLTALTDVDRCETHPQEAYLLNVNVVENLCAWIKAANHCCHLIHISTDQLYDGVGPHTEERLTIRNHYAMSKLAGEFVAGTVSSTILRTNFIGRSMCKGRLSLTDWLHQAVLSRERVNIFYDVMFSPLSTKTLCYWVKRCVDERPIGTFNLGSVDGMSKADFALGFAASLGLEATNLIPASAGMGSKHIARRPNDMRMNSQRFEERMGVSLPRFIDEIEIIADNYRLLT